MKLKQFYRYVFVFLLSVSIFTGCGSNNDGGTFVVPETNGTVSLGNNSSDENTTQENNNTSDVNTTQENNNTSDVNTTQENNNTSDVNTTQENNNTSDVNTTQENNNTSDENTTVVTKTKGYLIDSPLQGVTYLCDGEENLTDENGLFECANPPVTFKIGGLTLGTLTAFTADGKVYPQDLLGLARTNFTDSRLKLLARLVQSLDDDGDIGTKITITESVRSGITAVQEFKDMSQSDVQSLLSGLGKSLVKECGALEHLGDKSVSCGSDGGYYVDSNPISTLTPTPAPSTQKTTIYGIAQLGYIQNGTVSLYSIKDLNTPLATTQTSNSTDMSKAGGFSFENIVIDDGQYYLLSVTKGKDIDADDNGQADTTFTDLNGTIHALVSGKDLKSGFKINALTDMAYMRVKNSLSILNINSLNSILDSIAKRYIGDINEDGKITYSDMLVFNPIKDRDKIKINYKNILSSYIPSLHDNSSEDECLSNLLKNDEPKVIVANGALQKIPFRLDISIENLPKGVSVEWYLDSKKIPAKGYTVNEKGTFYLIGKLLNSDKKEVGTTLTEIGAINPKLVSSFEANADKETSKYVYAESNSSLSGTSILIPKGALKNDVTIKIKESTIANIPNTDGLPVSKLLTMEPAGLTFDKPITIRLPYEGEIDKNNIVIARNSNGVVDFIQPLYVDEKNKEVVFKTEHFTDFVLQVYGGLVPYLPEPGDFIDKPKVWQTELKAIENLLGTKKYTNDEWFKILNTKLDKESDLTIYDLVIKYSKLVKMQSEIKNEKYAEAIRTIYPKSTSALQKDVDNIKYVSKVVSNLKFFMGFKPNKISAEGAFPLIWKQKRLISVFGRLTGLPTSVKSVTSLRRYLPKPHEIVAQQFNKIDNQFYSEMWLEFEKEMKRIEDEYGTYEDYVSMSNEEDYKNEDYFMDYKIQNEFLRAIMEDDVIEGVKLKALVTPEMIHNLKLIYLAYKHFNAERDIQLYNIKLAIRLAYEDNADKQNVKVGFKHHQSYTMGETFKPDIYIFPSGYGTAGWKASKPKITLFLENGKKFATFSYDSFENDTEYNSETDSLEPIENKFVLKSYAGIEALNKEGSVTITWKYTDNKGVEKSGNYYVTFTKPKEPIKVEVIDYDLYSNNIDADYISVKPKFSEEVDTYNCIVTIGDIKNKSCDFVKIDDYKNILENGTEAEKEKLRNVKVNFNPRLKADYIFDPKEYVIDLVALYESEKEKKYREEWNAVKVQFYNKTIDNEGKISLELSFYPNVFNALKLDSNNNGIYNRDISNYAFSHYENYIKVLSKEIGNNKSCVLFQHKETKEERKICTDDTLGGKVELIAKDYTRTVNLSSNASGSAFIKVLSKQLEDTVSVSSIGSTSLGKAYEWGRGEGITIVYDAEKEGKETFTYTLKTESGLQTKTGHITIIIKKDELSEVSINLGQDVSLEEETSKGYHIIKKDDGKRINSLTCFTTPKIPIFDYTSSSISFTTPSYDTITNNTFVVRCSAKDNNGNILARTTKKVYITKKTIVEPTNQAPTVSLPSSLGANNKIVPTEHDDKGIVKHKWSVSWSGDKQSEASPTSATSNTLTLNVPTLDAGESLRATVTLTVYDAEGEHASDTKTYNYSVEKKEAIKFISDNFTDGEVIPRGSTKHLEWTVKNVSNVDLKDVQLNVTQEANSLTVSNIEPSTIALWEKGESKTFSVDVTTSNDITEGTHKQIWNFTYDGGKALPYEGKTSSASIFFEFKTTNPNDLVGRLITDKNLVTPNETVTSLLEITSGNAPYSIEVDWGDGNNEDFDDVVKNTDEGMTKSLIHKYVSEGEYSITVKVKDNAGKKATFTDTIKVEISTTETSWTADVHDKDTDEKESNINIIVESKYGKNQYHTNWSPSVKTDSTEYFVKYRLPIPSKLLMLNKKMRVTVEGLSSDIEAYDREINFRTSDSKEYTASIRHKDFEETLDNGAIIKGGYFTIKDLASGVIEKEEASNLNSDRVKLDGTYTMGINSGTLKVESYNGIIDEYDNLFSKSISTSSNWLTELDVTFKGNGVARLILLEYDLNNDGEFGFDEKLILSTSDKIVDWSQFKNQNIEILDKNLKECIGEYDDPKSIKVLYCLDKGIKDISGLEQFTNLETLWLNDNQIINLDSLSSLTKLKYLSINGNCIADFTPIKNVSFVYRDRYSECLQEKKHSYTRNNGIVVDSISDLMWQDENIEKKQWLTDTNYDICNNDDADTMGEETETCYDVSGDTASTYCNNLVLGGYDDWRLPTSFELDDIRKKNAISDNVAFLDEIFEHRDYDGYWSSSNSMGYPSSAEITSFSYDMAVSSQKNSSKSVRCVRSRGVR